MPGHMCPVATHILSLFITILLNIFIKWFFELSSQYNHPNSVATDGISIRNYVYFRNICSL